jgi:hypothetical protein
VTVSEPSLVPVERIDQVILVLRGHKVILDRDLAVLYGVTTGNRNKAVNRNIERFPTDFMIELTQDEFNDLRSRLGASHRGGTRKLPRAFTEQGVAMLSSVLRSYEEKVDGEYRTKRVILEMYDAMADAARTGKPYQSRLDPPPADPRVAHPESTRPAWAKKEATS